MYLSFDEYVNMGGTLDESTFTNLEYEAESIINWYTFNRLANTVTYPNEVKRCVYELINLMVTKNTVSAIASTTNGTQTPAIASQSNDGVSISYNVASAAKVLDDYKKNEKQIITRNLAYAVNGVGRRLLYRGVYPDE